MSEQLPALIVDDNRMNQKLLKSILSKFGRASDVAENGVEALKKIESNDYSIVFMDIRMPIMDGIECTKKIRGHEDNKISKLPIIAVTANPETKDSCMESGMNGFIGKPFTFQLIKDSIRTWSY